MIAYLRGTLHHTDIDHLIIDVNGVGYQVFCPVRTMTGIGTVGSEVALSIETQVREDAITLFGFSSAEDVAWFKKMTKIPGVGAKVALAIISTFEVSEFADALRQKNKSRITSAPGVGAKLAERILTELRDFNPGTPVTPTGSAQAGNPSPMSAGGSTIEQDAVSALINLGYSSAACSKAVASAMALADDGADLATLIRLGLRELTQ